MAKAIRCASLPQPRFHYTPVVAAGPWLRVSGMVALDAATGALESGGPEVETRRILANLTRVLPELGVTLDELVLARIFTTRFDEFAAINRAWEAALAGVAVPPARTSVGVVALPLGATVEIEFEFYRDGKG
jgi:2-iminobutanoate/2-iminopropanoate deaminase